MGTVNLRDRRIVVTGAGQGIGSAYARHLASSGARVVVNDIDADLAEATAAAITASDGIATVHPGSVADPSVADRLVASCVDTWGGIDGLVNNAGLFHAATIDEEEPGRARRLVEVNVLGTMYCGLSALRTMLARGSGSVVNVTSGTQSGARWLATYAASKGAIASLTYSWALEVAGTGVRVNAISPNAQTRMSRIYESWLGTSAKGQNTGKAPEANAPVVAYLLSDAARDVNGQVARVDGDELTLMSHPSLLEPPFRGDFSDADGVAAAFETSLCRYVRPLGLARVNATRDVPG